MNIEYFAISLIASTLGAISGIGGGVIIKPALDSFSSLNVATISFLASATVLAMTIVTLYRNRNLEIRLDRRVSILLAVGGVFGGLSGKFLFDVVRGLSETDSFIGALQSAILGLMVIGVLLFLIFKQRIPPRRLENAPATLLVGVLLGSIASFLGIGGGPINIAVLYLLFSMNSKQAALNSIFIIFLSQCASLIFTAARGLIPVFEPSLLAFMIAGGVLGGLLGSQVTRAVSLRGVDRIFGAVLIIILGMSVSNFIQFL